MTPMTITVHYILTKSSTTTTTASTTCSDEMLDD